MEFKLKVSVGQCYGHFRKSKQLKLLHGILDVPLLADTYFSLPAQHLAEEHGKASWCLIQLCLKFSLFQHTDRMLRGHKFISFRNVCVNVINIPN